MQSGSDDGPRLVVVSKGDLEGLVVPLRSGLQVIGRGDAADARVVHPALSRQHALLQWDGHAATIADAGSTNGTRINGERLGLDERRALHNQDLVEFGSLELRFEGARTLPAAFLDETREEPVVRLENRIARDNYGQVLQAGHDVNFAEWSVNNRFGPGHDLDEFLEAKGRARVLMTLGLVVLLLGFAGWMTLIFSGSNSGGVYGAAFGVMMLGGVLFTIGGVMSRADRKRAEDARPTVFTRPRDPR